MPPARLSTLACLLLATWACGAHQQEPLSSQAPLLELSLAPAQASLNNKEQQALGAALDDEYRAWATYDRVVRDFGPERPFIHIRNAEARHIEHLRLVFQRYGLPIPTNTWPERAPRFANLRAACEAAVDGEMATVKLYERLMRSTDREDLLALFESLQITSRDYHLPAFRRCAAGEPSGSESP